MKPLILTLALLLCPVAYALPESSPKLPPAIVGTWTYKLPDRNCTETYEYSADGTLHVTSNQEIGESNYEFDSRPDAIGFYKLTDTHTKDNRQKDCAGAITPVGNKAVLYILFNPEGDAYLACSSEAMHNCFGPVKRVKNATE